MKINKLSCGIVIYDEVREIQNLIPKLKLELKEYEVQWIFILNHEQSEIRKWISRWLESELPNTICIENPSNNLGFARQLILESSSNEYLYLTDPDIDLKPGNLIKLIELAGNEIMSDSSQKVAGYGGTVSHRSNNGFIQSTFDFLFLLTEIFPFAFQVQHHRHLVSVDHLPACHMLLNCKVARYLGGFSSALNKYGEDLDFTHRAYNADFRFIFLPSATVYHWQNLSLSRWFLKVFNMGRVQIPVQISHYKKGLRYYRIVPLISVILFTGLIFFSEIFFIFATILTLIISFVNIGFLGFLIMYFLYGLGELFELFVRIFERKNVIEPEELNKILRKQICASNNTAEN
jgi:GT2 family glycosyltransferase